MERIDGRTPEQLRPLRISIDSFGYAEGSALIEVGNTRVLCNATVEENVPPWMRGKGSGWVTGEYALLPRATQSRTRRERNGASGRTQEIQRLIGRALRAAVDLEKLGERTVTIDCDVLQADGGTRCAAITGGCVALAIALQRLVTAQELPESPLTQLVAAVSVGYLDGVPLLDLNYVEDSSADLDSNIIQTSGGGLVEVQCTAEGRAISRAELDTLLDLANAGIVSLLEAQQHALRTAGVIVL